MEPESEEIPDFSPFSRIRRIALDPESVVGKELVENFEQLDESFNGKNKSWSAVVKLIAERDVFKGLIDLEKQVIDLRREVRTRAGT